MSLSERMRIVVSKVTTEYRRFKQLETLTGIQADTWKSWFHGRQRPTAEMIEAICSGWPEYAFWVSTGYEDGAYGHVAPDDSGYPFKTTYRPNSAAYFAALRECRAEAERIAKAWFKLRFDEEPDASVEVPDRLLRVVQQLGLPAELTKGMAELVRKRITAEKLRRAEILLHTELPQVADEETDAVGETVRKLLDSVHIGTTDTEAKAKLERKLQEELTEFERRHKAHADAASETSDQR
ncbi:MAG: hypothetical protein ACM34A_01665 [Bacillota bacterium]